MGIFHGSQQKKEGIQSETVLAVRSSNLADSLVQLSSDTGKFKGR